MTAHDEAVEAAEEALAVAIEFSRRGQVTPLAEAAVAAAAPILLAPIQAEVERLLGRCRDCGAPWSHVRERGPWETLVCSADSEHYRYLWRDEAVAAERQRIAAEVRTVPGQTWDDRGHWLLAADVFARIAEGDA